LALASKNPELVKNKQRAPTFQRRGSLNFTMGAIAAELAAITSIRQNLANGSTAGQIFLGTAPLLISFIATPIIVGTTTIINKDIAIPLISIAIFAPTRIDSVPGTTRGASMVSIKINERPNALSALKIDVHIKPETAVGPANRRTNPAIVSGFVIKREEKKKAANGIITWAEKKKSIIGAGVLTAVPSSKKVSF